MDDQRRCPGKNKEGGPCGALPQAHTDWCMWHDPERAAERANWNRKGGAATSKVARARKALHANVLTAEEMRGQLGAVLIGVIDGTIEPTVGTAAATLARALLDVARVAEIEAQVAQMRRDMAAFAERRGGAG